VLALAVDNFWNASFDLWIALSASIFIIVTEYFNGGEKLSCFRRFPVGQKDLRQAPML
jgi:hypothetical protein